MFWKFKNYPYIELLNTRMAKQDKFDLEWVPLDFLIMK